MVVLRLITLLCILLLTIGFAATSSSNMKAAGVSKTICIWADGSIDPPDAPISTVDNVSYVFTADINKSIFVQRNNITIDGRGHVLQGSYVNFSYGMSLSNVTNVTVKNITIQAFSYGIFVDSGSNNRICGNKITGNIDAIHFQSTADNSIYENCITDNSGWGVVFFISRNETLFRNNITGNHDGVWLAPSCNDEISENNITNNAGDGIVLYGFYFQGAFNSSSENNIADNKITNNGVDGIRLLGSPNNTISRNNIMENQLAMELNYSSHNMISNNNFANNAQQVLCDSSRNTWDSGYPSGGNYWSDYNGTDYHSGIFQNETGNDGIGDTPHVIDKNNADHYPLIQPWSPLPVHNLNTGFGYATIQEAIDAPETENGNSILVEEGIYYENVVINKSLSLVGENRETTIIDGDKNGITVSVEANSSSISNFTIRNSGNSDYDCGVSIHSSWNGLRNNIVMVNQNGILINPDSDANVLIGNDVNANELYGIHLWYSDNSILDSNTVTNGYDGIIMEFCSNTTLRNNNISGNMWNFGVGGEGLPYFIHDIDTSNKVEGKPIRYLTNQENIVIDSTWDIGYLCVVNSTNVTAKDLALDTPSWHGILFAYTENSRIENVTISETSYAIDLVHCSNNVIMNNSILNRNGIRLWNSNDNTIVNNDISRNGMAILLFYSSNNTIVYNRISNNWRGIFLYSSGNKIHHNSFIDNQAQVFTDQNTNANNWDDGYPSGGNYWSDYAGVDYYSGPYQNETGSDGIGDASYIINENNTDHYPLTGTFNSYDATYYTPPLAPHACNVTVISNSTISGFGTIVWIEHPEVTFLMFNASGPAGSTGFCRVSFPTAMMNGTYHVTVNGTEIPCILLPCSDANHTYLYFTYEHSTEEIIIMPEFPSFLILPLFAMATLLAVIVHIRKSSMSRRRS